MNVFNNLKLLGVSQVLWVPERAQLALVAALLEVLGAPQAKQGTTHSSDINGVAQKIDWAESESAQVKTPLEQKQEDYSC
jgi:hypothetical protein